MKLETCGMVTLHTWRAQLLAWEEDLLGGVLNIQEEGIDPWVAWG